MKQEKNLLRIILSITFLGFLGISMPYLIFPPLFLNPTYPLIPAQWAESSRALLLGITLAAYPIGQFIGSPILGSLSDQHGRKRLLSASLLITGLANLLTGVAIAVSNLILLILSRFIAGLMEGNIAIARAMGSDLKTIPKHISVGKINAAASVAYLIGPVIGALLSNGQLFENLTISTPFYYICALFLLLASFAMIGLPTATTHLSRTQKTLWRQFNFIQRILNLFTNKSLKFFLLVSTCFTIAVDIFYEFGPVFLTMKWMLTPTKLIFYNGAVCFGLLIGNAWLPTLLASKVSSKAAITYALGSFGLSLFGVVLIDSPILMISLFTFSGLVIGLAVTLLTVQISDSASETIQGEVLGTQQSLRVLGDGMICLLGGILLTLSSKLILLIASALALSIMIYYAAMSKPKLLSD